MDRGRNVQMRFCKDPFNKKKTNPPSGGGAFLVPGNLHSTKFKCHDDGLGMNIN